MSLQATTNASSPRFSRSGREPRPSPRLSNLRCLCLPRSLASYNKTATPTTAPNATIAPGTILSPAFPLSPPLALPVGVAPATLAVALAAALPKLPVTLFNWLLKPLTRLEYWLSVVRELAAEAMSDSMEVRRAALVVSLPTAETTDEAREEMSLIRESSWAWVVVRRRASGVRMREGRMVGGWGCLKWWMLGLGLLVGLGLVSLSSLSCFVFAWLQDAGKEWALFKSS